MLVCVAFACVGVTRPHVVTCGTYGSVLLFILASAHTPRPPLYRAVNSCFLTHYCLHKKNVHNISRDLYIIYFMFYSLMCETCSTVTTYVRSYEVDIRVFTRNRFISRGLTLCYAVLNVIYPHRSAYGTGWDKWRQP